MSRGLVIIGGGGHARAVVEAATTDPAGWTVLGYVDGAPTDAMAAHGVPYLGPDAVLGDERTVPLDACLVLGIGRGPRRDLVARFDATGRRWASVVHGAAWCSPTAAVGAGTVVLAGAIVQAGVRLGDHVIVNTAASIDHDSTIGDRTHVAPGAHLGGRVRVGADAHIGIGAAVRDGIRVGEGAVVGMGAVVVADVPEGLTVIGVPARPRSVDG